MSRHFRYFKFAELEPGEWVGEDHMFHMEQQQLQADHTYESPYTVRCKTDCVVLEIATTDLYK